MRSRRRRAIWARPWCVTTASSIFADAPSGEWEVITEKGTIVAEMVVNAAGCYAREVAAMVGADAPITNMQHHYVVTHPIQAFIERSEEIPVMRDSYTSGYFRQEQKSGLMGIYESTGLHEAWAPRGFPEWESSNELFPDDLDRIAPWLERAIERMPIFGEVGIRRIINGAIPHTPDGAPLLGPAAGLEELLDVLRHLLRHRARRRLRQVPGAVDAARRCRNQHDRIRPAPLRPVRRQDVCARQGVSGLSPDLHDAPARRGRDGRTAAQDESLVRSRLQAQGCVHTETFGWERPKWFSLDGRAEDYSYRRNNVFEVVREEVAAVHERVGILDLTGFAKYDISGPRRRVISEPHLRQSHAAQAVGGIALVHMLSPGGRILGEMTVSRLAGDRFYALSAAAAELRDQDLLSQSLRPGESVRIENVTEERGVLVLSGPRSRELLGRLDRCAAGQRGVPLAERPRDHAWPGVRCGRCE